MNFYTLGEIPTGQGHIYIRRPSDDALEALLLHQARAGEIPVVYGCRQSGKTSLAIRIIEAAKSTVRTALVDLRSVYGRGGDRDIDQRQILLPLLEMISSQLGQFTAFQTWLIAQRKKRAIAVDNVNVLFHAFFSEFLPKHCDGEVLIVIDEFDRFVEFGKRWEFLLDCLYDHIHSPAAAKVRWLLVGLNPPNALVEAQDDSKFTIFKTIFVDDFATEDENVISSFAKGLGDDENARTAVATVLRATGGQPYLTNRLLSLLAEGGDWSKKATESTIEKFVVRNRFGAGRTAGERDEHFRYARIYLEFFPRELIRALTVYEEIRDGKSPGDLPHLIVNILIGAGLLALRGDNLEVKSPISREVFDEVWARQIRTQHIGAPERVAPAVADSKAPEVLVINMGGTLGMEVRPDGRVVEPTDPQTFFNRFEGLNKLIRPIIELPITPTDGTNIAPPSWVLLAETIYRYRDRDIAGVIIIHGTDTLAFTASALAYALGPSLPFPVVFTGSQAPYTKTHADALANILRACVVVLEGKKLPEVVVCFNDTVLRAVRTEKKDDYRFEGFHAPSEGPIAIIGETLRYQRPVRKASSFSDWALRADFEERIVKISQFPGLQPKFYQSLLEDIEVKGIIIESLGVGNLPTVGRYSLLGLIEQATNNRIPVLVSSRYPILPEFAALYQPAQKPLDLGAISALDMAPPAATTKFMWAIRQVDKRIASSDLPASQRVNQIKRLMQDDYVGEIGVSLARV